MMVCNKIKYMTMMICAVFLFNLQNVSANDIMAQLNFIQLARSGDVTTAKQQLKTNHNLRSMPAMGSSGVRLIEDAMITAASAKNASYDFVRLMIDNGADANASMMNQSGSSALSRAVTFVDIDTSPAWTKDGPTGSSREERIRIIELLINEGADIDTVNETTGNPILKIAMYKDIDVAKLLLEAGANPNPVNPVTQLTLMETLKANIKKEKAKLALIQSLKGAK